MRLNSISPARGSKKEKKRVGRGSSSGWGKTSGRGQKGKKSRSGGGVRPGFEGGQLPLQKRLPTFGFRSRIGASTCEVRTSEINAIEPAVITIDVLKANRLIRRDMKRVRIMLSGEVNRAIQIADSNISVTAGAVSAIEAAGGSVEDKE